MIKISRKNYKIYNCSIREWPKYSTQLLNVASQNSKAFSPKNIGSVKELWVEMKARNIAGTIDNWKKYFDKHSLRSNNTVTIAGKTIFKKIVEMDLNHIISEDMCLDYAKEVIYYKTVMGMAGEEMAIQAAGDYLKMNYEFSSSEDEKKGIDGWLIGSNFKIPVQVKPHNTVHKAHVHNNVDTQTQLYITYEEKKAVCYIHNPELINEYTKKPNSKL